MASKASFASSIFSGGATEKVGVKDIYEATVSADVAVTDYKSVLGTASDKTVEVFKTIRFNPKNAVKLISFNDGKVGINKDVLADRIENATGYRFDASKTYQQQMKADALKLFGEKTGLGNTGLLDADGNLHPLLTGDEVSARDFAELVSGITGLDYLKQFPDLQAQMALIGSVLKEAIELGLPDAIDDLLKMVSDENARKQLLISNLERCAKAGDLASLDKIKGYIGAKDMYARCPKLVTYVMQGYMFPTSGDQPKYEKIYNHMVSLFGEVNPNWDRDVRDGVVVGRLDSFTTASSSTQTVFTKVGNRNANGVDHVAMALIAPNYRSDALKNIAKQNFPKAAIG